MLATPDTEENTRPIAVWVFAVPFADAGLAQTDVSAQGGIERSDA